MMCDNPAVAVKGAVEGERTMGEEVTGVIEQELADVETPPFDVFKLDPELLAADHFAPTTTGFLVGCIVGAGPTRDRGPFGTDFCDEEGRTRPDEGRIPRGFEEDPEGIYARDFGSGGGEELLGWLEKLEIFVEIGVGNDALVELTAGIFSWVSV